MKITIETIPHNEQRYPTVGDWQFDENTGDLSIKVSMMGDWRYELLVGLHELVEAGLCRDMGIAEFLVDEFDTGYKGPYEEPGDDPDAPYYQQHFMATNLERLLANALSVNWQAYDYAVSEL